MRETRASLPAVAKATQAKKLKKERIVASANKGNRSAQFNLGIMYFLGEGCEENIVEARNWFEQAGEGGHASAQLNAGLMFDLGTPEYDVSKARQWYKSAARQGVDQARNNLCSYPAPTTICYVQHAICAQFNLGIMLNEDGDAAAAKRWFQEAAAQGNAVGRRWNVKPQ